MVEFCLKKIFFCRMLRVMLISCDWMKFPIVRLSTKYQLLLFTDSIKTYFWYCLGSIGVMQSLISAVTNYENSWMISQQNATHVWNCISSYYFDRSFNFYDSLWKVEMKWSFSDILIKMIVKYFKGWTFIL